MKCEHCNNEMVWEGSLRGGHLVCAHCESITDHDYNLRVKEIYESAMMVKGSKAVDPNADCTIGSDPQIDSAWTLDI